jgi:transcriptional regulator GlxA family with amidase domain
MKIIAFIIPQGVEILDLAGPLQVFREAKSNGFKVNIEFYSFQKNVSCPDGLAFGDIDNYRKADLKEGDYIFFPGVDFEDLEPLINNHPEFYKWIKKCSDKKVNVCSVCNAAFLLAAAGLLDNKECTTHWKRIELLKKKFPRVHVISDVLFVKNDNVYTSAGISAGIDMALSILEELKGPQFVNRVAQDLVIYHRRNHQYSQQSIYLDFRNHINAKIHEVQDYIIQNISGKILMEELGEKFAVSPRNLSRTFKSITGITIGEYIIKLRLEKAKTLRNNSNYTTGQIAKECGFQSERQLYRILKRSD